AATLSYLLLNIYLYCIAPQSSQSSFPTRRSSDLNRRKVAQLLHEMSATLSRYISGQMIECLFVGTFSAIGYSMTGIPYALLVGRSEEHTSELQSRFDLVCRLLLEKKKYTYI